MGNSYHFILRWNTHLFPHTTNPHIRWHTICPYHYHSHYPNNKDSYPKINGSRVRFKPFTSNHHIHNACHAHNSNAIYCQHDSCSCECRWLQDLNSWHLNTTHHSSHSHSHSHPTYGNQTPGFLCKNIPNNLRISPPGILDTIHMPRIFLRLHATKKSSDFL